VGSDGKRQHLGCRGEAFVSLFDTFCVLWLADPKSNRHTENKMEELAKKSVSFLFELDKKSLSASVSCLSLPRKVCPSCLIL